MNLKNIAKGTSESFKVDEGLILLKHTNESEHEENFNYDIGKDYIQFHFCLKGFSNFLFNEGSYVFNVENENSILLYNPHKELPINLVLNAESQVLSILISIKKFHSLFSSEADQISFLNNENAGNKLYKEKKIGPMIDKVYGWLPFEEPPPIKEFANQLNFSSLLKMVAGALGSLAGNAGLISIYVVFLFLEQRSFGPKIKGMAHGNIKENEVFKIITQIDKDTRKYIGIKTLTSLTTGMLSFAIMTSVGLDFAAFWAMLIFFFNFIPTVGSILATAFPSVLALIQFEEPAKIGVTIGGVVAAQVLVGNFLEPRLMGNSLNLSPLVILLSLSLWGSLWGVPGMFLCVPITVIAMIICSHFQQTRPIAVLLSGDGKIKGSS